MLAKAAQSQAERQAEREADDGMGAMKNHPVIRTMYDHDLVSLIKLYLNSTGYCIPIPSSRGQVGYGQPPMQDRC